MSFKRISPEQMLGQVFKADPAGAAHAAQLLQMTPEVTEAVRALRKVEISDEDKLDFGNYIQFESVRRFGGSPLRFMAELFEAADTDGDILQKRAVLYLCEEVEEMGGMVSYTYMTPVCVFDSVETDTFMYDMGSEFNAEFGGSCINGEYFNWCGEPVVEPDGPAAETVESAVTEKTQRIKKFRKTMEAACRGAADAVLGQFRRRAKQSVECALAEDEFLKLRKTAKYFTRQGKPDYQQAQVQMLGYVFQKNGLEDSPAVSFAVKKIQKINSRIDRLAARAAVRVEAGAEYAGKGLESSNKKQILELKRGQAAARQRREKQKEVIKNKLPVRVRAGLGGAHFGGFVKCMLEMKKPRGFVVRGERLVYKPEFGAARELFMQTYADKAAEVWKLYRADSEVDAGSELEKIDEAKEAAGRAADSEGKVTNGKQKAAESLGSYKDSGEQAGRDIESVVTEMLRQRPAAAAGTAKVSGMKRAHIAGTRSV